MVEYFPSLRKVMGSLFSVTMTRTSKKEELLKSLDQLEDRWLLQEPIILTYQDQDVSLS